MSPGARDRLTAGLHQLSKATSVAVTGMVVLLDAGRLAAVELAGKISKRVAQFRKD